MDDLIDMMVSNESPADISDRIKEILMQKSAENIDIVRPVVAASMFGEPEVESGEVPEVEEEPTEEDAE
jgi:hypothetical protein